MIQNKAAAINQCLKIANQYLLNQKKPLLNYQTANDLKKNLNLTAQSNNQDWAVIIDWIKKYLDHGVQTDHFGFTNRMWSSANLPSIMGEIICAISNTSSCSYESAPVSTLIEQHMIEKMLKLAGFEKGQGQMTTGSSNANMIAMMIARNLVLSNCKQTGLFNQKPLFAFVSEDAHYSMDKATNILGLGSQQLIKISVDEQGKMKIGDLNQAIQTVIVKKGIPFFVCATAGTTVRGAYDDINALLALRKQHNFWLHVDGAWGGAAVVSPKLRQQFLQGLEKANSFTWDFHKMLGANLICNVLLINLTSQPSNNLLFDTCAAGNISYVYREGHKQPDLGVESLQCGRRVDSLKWFLDWTFYGQDGFSKRIERYFLLCDYAQTLIDNEPKLAWVAPRQSFNLCFRFIPPPSVEANEFNLNLRDTLYKQGKLLIAFAYIKGEVTLRLLIVNPDLEKKDINELLKIIVQTGQQLVTAIKGG